MHAFVLLDRSGSMTPNWFETLGALNGYVSQLKKKTKVSIFAFDSTTEMEIETLAKEVPAEDFKSLMDKDVMPRGSTPLYDAIAYLDKQVGKRKKAAVTIITDGYENSSRECTKTAAAALIDGMKKRGYDINFIGADFDNYEQSASLGGSYGQTITSRPGNYGATMSALAMKNNSYAGSGKTREWTDAERKSSGEDLSEEKHQKSA